ncbi:MAG: ribosome maturation factor RimM [Terriglobales bacterium]
MTDAPSDSAADWITLALVVKTQGRRGDLAVELLSDIPDRFAQLRQLWLRNRSGQLQPFTLERTWPHKQWLVLVLAEIHDLTAARPWVGAQVQLPRCLRAPAPEGRYHVADLLGCRVFDQERLLGRLAAIEPIAGAADLLHIQSPQGHELLIPFVAGYLTAVDLGASEIRMRLPDGLLEINRDEV